MADTTALKNRIRAAIKANDNQEITGPVLQQTLLDIVDELDLYPELQEAINTEKNARQSGDSTLQQAINNEAQTRQSADTQLQSAINAIKANIDNGYVYAGIAAPSSTPVSGKVFYIATAAGTYTNFGGQVLTQGINILRFNGSAWSSQQLIGIDDVPTAGSNSLVKSGGVQNELALGAVYDVSAKNPTAGPNNDGKWESLSALLSDTNLNTLIPTAYRKGGMSIKFVQSSDNKYVQFRCKTELFSINPNDWEEVENTSKELTQEFEQGVSYIVGPNQTKYSKYLTADYCAILLPVNSGEEYSINGIGGGSLRLWATCSEDGTIIRRSDADIDRSTTSGLTETVTIEDGESILIVNSYTNSVITNHTSKVIVDTPIPSVIKNTRDELRENYNNLSEELSTKIDKNSGFLFAGIVDPSSQPVTEDPTCRYCYIANIPGTYTNCGGLVVNKGEICIFRRTYFPSQVVWQKSVVARQGDAIIAAYDAPAEWKAIASSNATSVADGLVTIALCIANKATDGDTIILSPGTFGSINSGVQIGKSINIVGQGKSTVLSRGNSWAEIWIESDGVNVSVRNVNIANFIRINAKSETEFYDSKLYLENIYLNGEPLDTDLINYVYKKRVPTLAISNSPYRWYATSNVVQGTPAASISAFTYGTSKLPASYDIKKRTVLLLPGNYKGTGAVYLGKTYPIALVGVPGHEKETIIHRTNKPANLPNDIVADGGGNVVSNYELRVENITVKEMINFQYCTNFHMINCWRDGIRLEDYDGGNSVGVGKNQIFLRLSYALDVIKTIAQPTNRYTIDIYGETEEIMTPIADTAGIDIEGHDSATILKLGYNHGGSPYGLAGALNVKDNWDGTIRNVTFKVAGVFIGKNFSAFQVMGDCRKGRFENIKCYNLTFPGKGVPANPSLPWDESTNAVKFHFDPENRMVICNSDTNSSTGYTAHVYSPIFGTEVGTYECTAEEAAKTNFYLLAIRKPDSEMRQHPDDPGGSRRYGLYVSCSNECDIIFTNCEGYGSPWGFHNTRGIYVDYGSPKLFNCIGVSGGIGFNLHGITCHRRSEAELVGCIGFASPFAYYGNGLNIDNFGGSGIKFQAASCAKLVGCIGYANDQQYSNGILCDYKTHPRLINCVGYNGGGEDTAGFALYDCASVDLVGGYYGKRLHNSTKLFEHESGSNGMVYYPYKRPVRLDSTEDEVIYGDHWKETLDVTDKPYRIESLSFDQSGIGELINDYLCFYDVNETTSEKTLIGKGSFTSIGDFQMANFVPYQTGNQHYDMEIGHHLYICIEDANGNELSSHSGVIRPIVTTSELGTRSSGVYIKQYWVINWGSPQPDPTAPDIVIPDDALLSGLEAYDNNWSLRIGENADIAHRYVVANATLKGDLERDVPTASNPRIYNSVKIVDDTVTVI